MTSAYSRKEVWHECCHVEKCRKQTLFFRYFCGDYATQNPQKSEFKLSINAGVSDIRLLIKLPRNDALPYRSSIYGLQGLHIDSSDCQRHRTIDALKDAPAKVHKDDGGRPQPHQTRAQITIEGGKSNRWQYSLWTHLKSISETWLYH